jgi:hypothetical protein
MKWQNYLLAGKIARILKSGILRIGHSYNYINRNNFISYNSLSFISDLMLRLLYYSFIHHTPCFTHFKETHNNVPYFTFISAHAEPMLRLLEEQSFATTFQGVYLKI